MENVNQIIKISGPKDEFVFETINNIRKSSKDEKLVKNIIDNFLKAYYGGDLFAKYNNHEHGFKNEKNLFEKEKFYKVKLIKIRSCKTFVNLEDFEQAFNDSAFEFFVQNRIGSYIKIDIYKIGNLSPYIQKEENKDEMKEFEQ